MNVLMTAHAAAAEASQRIRHIIKNKVPFTAPEAMGMRHEHILEILESLDTVLARTPADPVRPDEATKKIEDLERRNAALSAELERLLANMAHGNMGRVRLAGRMLAAHPGLLVHVHACSEPDVRQTIRTALQAADMLIEEAQKP